MENFEVRRTGDHAGADAIGAFPAESVEDAVERALGWVGPHGLLSWESWDLVSEVTGEVVARFP